MRRETPGYHPAPTAAARQAHRSALPFPWRSWQAGCRKGYRWSAYPAGPPHCHRHRPDRRSTNWGWPGQRNTACRNPRYPYNRREFPGGCNTRRSFLPVHPHRHHRSVLLFSGLYTHVRYNVPASTGGWPYSAREHPCIFETSSLRTVDDEAVRVAGESGQAAGPNRCILAAAQDECP